MTNDLGVWTADDSALVLIAILVGLGVAVSGWALLGSRGESR